MSDEKANSWIATAEQKILRMAGFVLADSGREQEF